MNGAKLHRAIFTGNRRIIGIDGELGVGKSSLAKSLASQYGLEVLSIDDFCVAGKGQYVQALDLKKLRRRLEIAAKPVILEGVCLLKVLEKLQLHADVHIFLYAEPPFSYIVGSQAVAEVEHYLIRYAARNKADLRINMNQQTNNLDVDIAYLKAKTLVAVVLAIGGITALVVGAIVLTIGVGAPNNSAIFEFADVKVTAEGIGAVILGSSVFWAYFSYLSRPVYARRRESISKSMPDGSTHSEERETSTMTTVDSD